MERSEPANGRSLSLPFSVTLVFKYINLKGKKKKKECKGTELAFQSNQVYSGSLFRKPTVQLQAGPSGVAAWRGRMMD